MTNLNQTRADDVLECHFNLHSLSFYILVSIMFRDIYKVTNVSKLRSFQYRLIHNAIVTNKRMFLWKQIESPNCTFCDRSEENILHLLVNCEYVKSLWENLRPTLKIFSKQDLEFNYETILLNKIHPVSGHVSNLLCLVVKQYIYRQRCKKVLPVPGEAKELIYQIRNLEKYIAIKNNTLEKHEKKWGVYDE